MDLKSPKEQENCSWPYRTFVRWRQNKRDRWYGLQRAYPELVKRYHHIGPVQHTLHEDKECSKIGQKGVTVEDVRVGDYVLGCHLGSGGFANVFQAQSSFWRGHVAIKVIPKHRETVHDGRGSVRKQLKSLHTEIGILQKHSHHPNIVDFYGVIHSPKNVYLILQMGDMSLWQYITKHCVKDVISFESIRQIIKGILQALSYLHKKGIYHMDLKPGNILLTGVVGQGNQGTIQASNIRLCDFGISRLAKNFDPKDPANTNKEYIPSDYFIGSKGFAAPELESRKGGEAGPTDMWSVGCILLFLLNKGRLPSELKDTFRYGYMASLAAFLLKEQYVNRYSLTATLGEKLAKDFLYCSLLCPDPKDRLTPEQALKHQYLAACTLVQT